MDLEDKSIPNECYFDSYLIFFMMLTEKMYHMFGINIINQYSKIDYKS